MSRQRSQWKAENRGQKAYGLDPVKEDQVWRELHWRERRGVKEWETKWGFLRGYDQVGQQNLEKPPLTNKTPLSNRVPNTSNGVYGSRLSDPLGIEIVRMDRLLTGRVNHRKQKISFDMKPF